MGPPYKMWFLDSGNSETFLESTSESHKKISRVKINDSSTDQSTFEEETRVKVQFVGELAARVMYKSRFFSASWPWHDLDPFVVCALRLRRNTHWQQYVSFLTTYFVLSRAGLRHLGKGWIVRGTTTIRLPYMGITGSSTPAGTGCTIQLHLGTFTKLSLDT